MPPEGRLPSAAVIRALEASLRNRITGEVNFSTGSRALYATDASNYRQMPIGVVVPRVTDDVVETVRTCREYGAAILPAAQARAWLDSAATWPLSSTCLDT
jgi:FAD/FMN-containing dehydrogenase